MGRERGTSLVEALVAIAVAALALGAGLARVPGAMGAVRLRGAAVQLGAAMMRARAAAVAEGRAWELRCAGESAFEIAAPGDPPQRESLPPGIRFAATTSGGSVRFLPAGSAENATFVLRSDGGGERRVVVNQRGRIAVD